MRLIKIVFLLIGLFSANAVFAQKSKKLSKDEMTRMTNEQRLVHETNRKSKNGKKEMSNRKKVKVQKKTNRRSEKIKQPKQKKRKGPI